MTLTRREFLQAIGIAAASKTFPFDFPFIPTIGTPAAIPASAPPPLLAGLINAVEVYEAPTLAARKLMVLEPNSVVPILGSEPGFYRVSQGYIWRQFVQPILREDYHPPISIDAPVLALPTWVQNHSLITHLYSQANVSTLIDGHPLQHGAIMQAVDFLPADSRGAVSWTALANEQGQQIGWSQAHLWRTVELPVVTQDESRSVLLDKSEGVLTAYQGDQEVFSTPFVGGWRIFSGDYTIARKIPGSSVAAYPRYGAPYTLEIEGADRPFHIHGAYWHNLYGYGRDGAHFHFDLTVYAARALYAFAPIGMRVTVI